MNGTEVTGIIRNVGYGMRDLSRPCLWFEVFTSEGTASLQIFTGEAADKIITDALVYDVKQLEGKPCWVAVGGNSMTFLRMWSNP